MEPKFLLVIMAVFSVFTILSMILVANAYISKIKNQKQVVSKLKLVNESRENYNSWERSETLLAYFCSVYYSDNSEESKALREEISKECSRTASSFNRKVKRYVDNSTGLSVLDLHVRTQMHNSQWHDFVMEIERALKRDGVGNNRWFTERLRALN